METWLQSLDGEIALPIACDFDGRSCLLSIFQNDDLDSGGGGAAIEAIDDLACEEAAYD
jgi:hypothetical protein